MTRPKAAAVRTRRRQPAPAEEAPAPAPAPARETAAPPAAPAPAPGTGRASPPRLGGTSIAGAGAGRASPRLGGTSIAGAGRASPRLGGTAIAGAIRRPSSALGTQVVRPTSKRARPPGADSLALVLTQQPANDDGQRLSEFCTTYKKKKGAKGMTKKPKQEKPPRPPLIQPPPKKQAPPAAQRAQVRIVDGQLVVAEPAAPETAPPEVEEEGLIEVRGDDAPGATSASYSNRVPSERWGLEETRRFYDALRRFGTDFTMMLTVFPGRTQRQLKNKFKRENRTQMSLVSLALDASIASDLTAPLIIEAVIAEKPDGLPAAFGPTDAERAALVAIFDPAKDDEDELEAV